MIEWIHVVYCAHIWECKGGNYVLMYNLFFYMNLAGLGL
jgi:hypothetical protein